MKKQYSLSIFIFRRDLRLSDNTALNQALHNSDSVLACFIFDPRQIGEHNQYKSMNAVEFMCESLHDLEEQFRQHDGQLHLLYGPAEAILEQLLNDLSVQAVYINRDYTPFSLNRDRALENICLQHRCAFHSYDDALLNPPDAMLKADHTPYTVFSPFFKKASILPVKEPQHLAAGRFYTKPLAMMLNPMDLAKKINLIKNPALATHGGTADALKILESLQQFKTYAHDHDYPAISTTHLSAHLKFGTLSARTVYYALSKALGKAHPLIRQLYWRDFFTQVAYYSPFVFGQAFHAKYNALAWSKNEKHFDAWCTGNTGFPIVDAGMRELTTTGFMHNRVRMIVASFLTKDLHIDWRKGEEFFAQHLIDYDPAVNNGNWQWCASTGCDAQPYFRIFNPWTQQKQV